jgi:DNA gyrase subunit B
MDDKDVEAYVQRVANKFKRAQIVDPASGQIDTRYNALPVWKKTPIPLLDGRVITIEELSAEVKSGKESWVYSIQDTTHKIVPGKVIWCDKNYTAEQMVKVWLDDDTYVVTAPEHPFVMRDGSKKDAKDLVEGDSLMPFYRKIVEDGTYRSKYEKIYNPKKGLFEYTHVLMALNNKKNRPTDNTIHHINFNKYDNRLSNLKWMGYDEHSRLHGDILREKWRNPEYRKKKIEENRKWCIEHNSMKI